MISTYQTSAHRQLDLFWMVPIPVHLCVGWEWCQTCQSAKTVEWQICLAGVSSSFLRKINVKHGYNMTSNRFSSRLLRKGLSPKRRKASKTNAWYTGTGQMCWRLSQKTNVGSGLTDIPNRTPTPTMLPMLTQILSSCRSLWNWPWNLESTSEFSMQGQEDVLWRVNSGARDTSRLFTISWLLALTIVLCSRSVRSEVRFPSSTIGWSLCLYVLPASLIWFTSGQVYSTWHGNNRGARWLHKWHAGPPRMRRTALCQWYWRVAPRVSQGVENQTRAEGSAT